MKTKILILSFILLSAFAVDAQTVQPADSSAAENKPQTDNKITGNIEMNYLKHYIWRGMLFGSNDVAQPELNLKWRKFSLGLCANLNYNPSALPKEYYKKLVVFDEQDIEIGYATSYKKFDLECKAMAYTYFNQLDCPNTAELYNKITYNLSDKLSFFTESSVDIASYSGAFYSNTGICFSQGFDNDWSVELTGYASAANKKFNTVYFETETGGYNLVGASMEVSKEFGAFYFTVFGEINNYSSKAIKESTGLKTTDNFSIAVGWNF